MDRPTEGKWSAVANDEVNVDSDYGGSLSYNHILGGGNVLFMDGHVEFVKHPGIWPICRTWATFFVEVEGPL